MTREQKERRAEEVARVRSYLASQAMRRTPQQLTEALQEAHEQFLTAAAAVAEQWFSVSPGEDAWTAADVLAHVYAIASLEERSILAVIERGETPVRVGNELREMETAARAMSREQLLAGLKQKREALIAAVLQVDPQAHLDIIWGQSEFGQMNWREWLLFARVHVLDHMRQMEAIAATLAQTYQERSMGA